MWYLVAFVVYTALLFIVAHLTSSHSNFFSGGHKAPWYVVAYGMIGASISGVSFISVPGNVWAQNFFYMPMVLGFVVGYIVIANVLLPLYYRMGLTSIYEYLGQRFGAVSHKTGSAVFMVSRVLGAAVRIFVVIVVLCTFLPWKPSMGTVTLVSIAFLALLYLYTYKGGVKTIIWTDVFQTTVMLGAIVLSIVFICSQMGWSFSSMLHNVGTAVNTGNPSSVGYGLPFVSVCDWNWSHGTNAVKQFISGIFVTVAMTGLDQSMMQKNLSCKDLRAAKKNMYTTAVIIFVVNLFFVLLGALLCVYASHLGGFSALGITKTDELFGVIARKYLGTGVGVLFLLGLLSASYPSAGGALTSLTTSFCVDYLGGNVSGRTRKLVQGGVALLFLAIILVLYAVSSDAVVNLVYKLASYTYGPLLGMFFFGILSKCSVRDRLVPFVALAAPVLCLLVNLSLRHFCGFDLGFSLLIVNALLTYVGMLAIRQ